MGTPDCIITTHHLYWPSYEYTDKIDRKFRELPQNKQRLSWCDHQEVHANQEPPEHPSKQDMVAFLVQSGIHLSASIRKEIRKESGQTFMGN
jgi:hypothetical protein